MIIILVKDNFTKNIVCIHYSTEIKSKLKFN